jgi:hypothetical protein
VRIPLLEGFKQHADALVSFETLWSVVMTVGETAREDSAHADALISELRSANNELRAQLAELRGKLAESNAKLEKLDFITKRLSIDKQGPPGPQGFAR